MQEQRSAGVDLIYHDLINRGLADGVLRRVRLLRGARELIDLSKPALTCAHIHSAYVVGPSSIRQSCCVTRFTL